MTTTYDNEAILSVVCHLVNRSEGPQTPRYSVRSEIDGDEFELRTYQVASEILGDWGCPQEKVRYLLQAAELLEGVRLYMGRPETI